MRPSWCGAPTGGSSTRRGPACGLATYLGRAFFELSGETQTTLYIPAGCAHGFQSLTETSDVSYRIDRAHDPAEDVTIAFDDPDLAIDWPLPVASVSPRDREAPSLADFLKHREG